ncbi:MAG: diguanylate cyclase [Egibacteraceae bacterium]
MVLPTIAMAFVGRTAVATTEQALEEVIRLTADRVASSPYAEVAELAQALNAMAAQLEEQRDELRWLSLRDGLTGLYNHREFHRRLPQMLETASKSGQPLSLLAVDLDHFKSVNDREGHQAGDRVLSAVAGAMLQTARTTDVAARLGGDEFALVLPDTDADGAQHVAERLRTRVTAMLSERSHLSSVATMPAAPELGISVGVATAAGPRWSARQLAQEADEALYRAKGNGRNRVWIAGADGRRKSDEVPLVQ